ncbi:MAG: hypothetical protein JWR69_868 [Pedosphaera sp.]|nr:hypothetical protein [Pedosphaera sp.]
MRHFLFYACAFFVAYSPSNGGAQEAEVFLKVQRLLNSMAPITVSYRTKLSFPLHQIEYTRRVDLTVSGEQLIATMTDEQADGTATPKFEVLATDGKAYHHYFSNHGTDQVSQGPQEHQSSYLKGFPFTAPLSFLQSAIRDERFDFCSICDEKSWLLFIERAHNLTFATSAGSTQCSFQIGDKNYNVGWSQEHRHYPSRWSRTSAEGPSLVLEVLDWMPLKVHGISLDVPTKIKSVHRANTGDIFVMEEAEIISDTLRMNEPIEKNTFTLSPALRRKITNNNGLNLNR